MKSNQRKQFTHERRVIYQWQQTLDSILLFIAMPPIPSNMKRSQVISVLIRPTSLQVGIKGNPPYLKHQLTGIVDTDQSLWYVEKPNQKQQRPQEIVIQLQKAQKGLKWGCVFKNHQNLNPLEQQQLKKNLMLERFQQQHPGFDFSEAQFNGQVPDARNFMGGIKYN